MGETMTAQLDAALDRELCDELEKGGDIASMRPILLKYKDKGFGSESVYKLLGAMRSCADEDVEDRILELMDIVSGFCSPEMRVW